MENNPWTKHAPIQSVLSLFPPLGLFSMPLVTARLLRHERPADCAVRSRGTGSPKISRRKTETGGRQGSYFDFYEKIHKKYSLVVPRFRDFNDCCSGSDKEKGVRHFWFSCAVVLEATGQGYNSAVLAGSLADGISVESIFIEH